MKEEGVNNIEDRIRFIHDLIRKGNLQEAKDAIDDLKCGNIQDDKYIKLVVGNQGYVDRELIQKCEDTAKLKLASAGSGADDANPLEILAIVILGSSAEYYGVGFGELSTKAGTPPHQDPEVTQARVLIRRKELINK
jgi:hypothetical protein